MIAEDTDNTRFRLILASTSPYRRELLARLGLPFEQMAPECDESPEPGETPARLVERLAQIKARSILSRLAAESTGSTVTLVIGSDQVADCSGRILGKPKSVENAELQLAAMSGRTVVFRTAMCVVSTGDQPASVDSVNVTARFRELSTDEIKRYVAHDQPLDCAGAFRSEARGIALLESLSGDDPNALIGLPLIRLAARLREHGVALP